MIRRTDLNTPESPSQNDSPAGGQTLLQSRPSLPAGGERKLKKEALKTPPQYTVTITTSLNHTWSFRYVGELSAWVRFVIRLAGWKATRAS